MLIVMENYPDDFMYQASITVWVIEAAERQGIPFAALENESGISEARDGRKLRAIRAGTRRWSISDIQSLAKYFKLEPSLILAQAELILKTRPGEVRKYIDGHGGRSAPLYRPAATK